MVVCWGKQQNTTKNQNTNKITLAGKEHRESPEMARIYHAPSPEDPSPSGKLDDMKSHHAPTREEHLLACEHHAPVYGQPGKTRLVVTEAEDDGEHFGSA
jgi:hypothetical protein